MTQKRKKHPVLQKSKGNRKTSAGAPQSLLMVGQTTFKVNTYLVFTACIERGIEQGYTRAHKHTNKPSAYDMKDAVYTAVMNEVSEYFSFGEFNNDDT